MTVHKTTVQVTWMQ